MTVLNVAISGATGRMGRMLLKAVDDALDMTTTCALTSENNSELGTCALHFLGKNEGPVLTSDIHEISNSQVLIDFSRPAISLQYLAYCVEHKIGIVIGTTGFDAEGVAAIQKAAETIPVVYAPNMSVGVNTVLSLIEKAGKLLADYDCEIVEMHHKHKVDAPSGTALEMGRRVARGRGQKFEDVAVLSREGFTGERKPGTIGFAALRGGDVVGDHTVIFAGTGERIEISHKSGSREGYAQGALVAARFILKKNNGLFGMTQVLGLD